MVKEQEKEEQEKEEQEKYLLSRLKYSLSRFQEKYILSGFKKPEGVHDIKLFFLKTIKDYESNKNNTDKIKIQENDDLDKVKSILIFNKIIEIIKIEEDKKSFYGMIVNNLNLKLPINYEDNKVCFNKFLETKESLF